MLAWLTLLAEDAPKAPPPGLDFMPLLLIGAAFLIFIFLPMRRDRKQRMELVASIEKGDRVVLNNTFVGVVDKVVKADTKDFEDELLVRIDENSNVKMRVLRSSVTRVIKETKKESKEGA